jgi:hypothetical protein
MFAMGDFGAERISPAAARRMARRLSWRVALLGALLVAMLLPAGAAAAARLTFNLRMGSECITGRAAADTTARVVWKDSDGLLKARVDVVTNSFGGWAHCSASSNVEIGDTIKVSDGLGRRTITVPVVTLVLDRANNQFYGRAPANTNGHLIWLAGLYEDYFTGAAVTSDGDGKWSFKPSADFDLMGEIAAGVDWTTAKGDTFSAYRLTPYVHVTLDRSTFKGGGADPNEVVTFKLKDPVTSMVVGFATATANQAGSFAGQFRNDEGEPVVVSPGLRVKSALAADLNWIVPQIEGSADVANDFVFGRCHDTGSFYDLAVVSVYRDGERRGFALADPDSSGEFAVDFGQQAHPPYDPVNIQRGDRVRIECIHATGDRVLRSFRVL